MKYIIIILLLFGVSKGQEKVISTEIHILPLTETIIPYTSGGSGTVNLKSIENEKHDTVKVLCQVSDTALKEIKTKICISYFEGRCFEEKDTTFRLYNNEIKWKYLYSVREKHNTSEGVNDAGISPWMWKDYWKHLYYLDENKKTLPKNIVVWQSIELPGNKENTE